MRSDFSMNELSQQAKESRKPTYNRGPIVATALGASCVRGREQGAHLYPFQRWEFAKRVT